MKKKTLDQAVSLVDMESGELMPVASVEVPTVRFKNPYNASLFAKDHEVNPLPSLTVPDQSMTVREILIRHSNGIPFQAGRVPIYDGAEDFNDFLPNLASLDISERQDLYERSQRYLENYRNSEAKNRKDEERERFEREVEKRMQSVLKPLAAPSAAPEAPPQVS